MGRLPYSTGEFHREKTLYSRQLPFALIWINASAITLGRENFRALRPLWGGRPNYVKVHASVLHAISWGWFGTVLHSVPLGLPASPAWIARQVIPRVSTPVCCVQYGVVHSRLHAMIARSKRTLRAGARTYLPRARSKSLESRPRSRFLPCRFTSPSLPTHIGIRRRRMSRPAADYSMSNANNPNGAPTTS